jgi:thiamine biosynthesis lipoprotein
MTPVPISSPRGAITRRRALQLVGSVAGCLLVPQVVVRAEALRHEWTGAALGAVAHITLYHPDAGAARSIIRACLAEIDRLEGEFSLFRPDSALCRLNRDGVLVNPSLDMRRLLTEAVRFGDLSGGRFDVTVQPLWRLLAAHHAAHTVPPRADLQAALALVDYRRIDIDSRRIRLGQPGMAVTLNGIAQGFITDRVATILRSGGCDSVLADLGEIRALGTHPNGRAWQIGLADPWAPDRITHTLEVTDQAVATSAATGFQFDSSGRFHHLLDPKTGTSAARYASVSVVARDATAADALSTALTLMPTTEADQMLRAGAGSMALFTHLDGKSEIRKGDLS